MNGYPPPSLSPPYPKLNRHLAEKWGNQKIARSRIATGRNGGSTSNNLVGIELFVLLDLLGVESPRVPSYFGATHWAHQLSLAIEQRLWDAKLHGTQVLARRKEGISEERADDDEDMDQLDGDEPLKAYFTKEASWGGIDDDHRPFLNRGVPIFHVIPTPFPNVWHKLEVIILSIHFFSFQIPGVFFTRQEKKKGRPADTWHYIPIFFGIIGQCGCNLTRGCRGMGQHLPHVYSRISPAP